MIARAGSGWQTVLADLSLILFMVTASAVAQAGDDASAGAPQSPAGEPLALWRMEGGAPSLGEWLAGEGADARQQLTIIAHYAPGGLAEALDRASALARTAQAAGQNARLVVEPGEPGIVASLAYDVPEATRTGAEPARR